MRIWFTRTSAGRQETVKVARPGAEESPVVTASPPDVTLRLGYMRRALIVVAAVLGLTVVPVVRVSGPVASAQAPIGSVIVEGTGNGHGRGMSQWGAYGWAVDQGWTWTQILDHYYGNTAMGDTDTSATIDVQLKALDGVPTVGVVSYVNDVVWAGKAAPAMYANEIAPNVFDIWTASAPTCAPIGDPSVSWALLAGSVPGPLEFTTDNGPVNAARMTTGPATSALGVCDRTGRVTHYRGSIRVEDGAANRVVNRVLIEDYLRGVVPREISASWADAGGGRGMQAVMAQAVAARSFAVQPGRWSNGICDTQSCQVYFGAASRPSAVSSATAVEDVRSDTAIAVTVGKVRRWLVDVAGAGTAGSIVSTEYSGSNGPRTAGWPFPVRDDVPGDGTSLNRNHRWTRVLDGDALAARHGIGTLLSVSMVKGDPRYDGIWYNDVVLAGTSGTVRIPAWTFRGQNGLPSPGFTLRGEPRGARPMAADQRIELQVVGESVTRPDGTVAVIPAGVSAVALNITAVGPSAQGYATVWPCDVARPESSNLNFVTGSVVANGVVAPVGASGKVCFYSNATTHFLVDIAGWFSDGGGSSGGPAFVGVSPLRVVDTRNAIGVPRARIPAGGTIEVPMVGAAMRTTGGTSTTIPADATAVAVNVTAVGPARSGYFTVWPCGAPRPVASNVNFTPGSVVANGVVAPLGADGAICIFSDQTSDVLVDVLGWFGGAGQPAFVGANPLRLVDTRNAVGGPTGVVTPSTPRSVLVRGVTVDVGGVARQVPADASAVALNVTMVDAGAEGYATVWPCGTPRPEASNVNFAAGATVANGVVAPIGPDGSVCVYTSTDAHLLVDLAGWFAGGADAAFVGNIPERLVDTRNNIGPVPQ